MGSSFRGALLVPLMLACAACGAQTIYVCKDATGRTFTSDRPVPECGDATVRVLDGRGMMRREIAPPPTAEQKRQMQVEMEKRLADEAEAEERRRQDRAITLRYRSEADIEYARSRTLAAMREQLKRENGNLAAAEKEHALAQADANVYRKKNVAVPLATQRKVDDAARTVDGARKIIQSAEEEIERINAQFDTTAKRFRELAGTTASR